MIKIRIRNDDHEIDLQFPISENKLYAKLAEIHAIEGKDAPQSAFVTEVYWPEELSMLKDRFANLDELNYLARRMESFDYHEYDQFLIGITKLENPTEKDLINLTFNLDHFTLCKDVSSYGKIGREYVMNTEGAVPAHDEDDPKYAAIGKALIDRGLAQITAKGLLIYNPFDELTEVYDGQTFPEYYYENTLASAEVSYNGRTELLLLPGEELAIQKALARLGAPSDSDCEIRFCLSKGEDDAWEERIEGIIRSEGLYEANKMLRFLDTGDMDWGKLTAAVELTDAKSAANIGAVAEHLGEFAYAVTVDKDGDVVEITVVNDLIPEIGTTATIDEEKEVCATEVFTLTDTVEYKHLVPGKEYTVKGILMDKATGEPFLQNGEQITSEVTFVPEAPSGSVEVLFTFDAKLIKADTNIVVFESLYSDSKELTVHADIEDEAQTVTVIVPEIKTEASTDGKKETTIRSLIRRPPRMNCLGKLSRMQKTRLPC